jgi:hypothetical protein
LQKYVLLNKERRGLMKSTKEFWSKKQFTDSSSMEKWLLARERVSGTTCTDEAQTKGIKDRLLMRTNTIDTYPLFVCRVT